MSEVQSPDSVVNTSWGLIEKAILSRFDASTDLYKEVCRAQKQRGQGGAPDPNAIFGLAAGRDNLFPKKVNTLVATLDHLHRSIRSPEAAQAVTEEEARWYQELAKQAASYISGEITPKDPDEGFPAKFRFGGEA